MAETQEFRPLILADLDPPMNITLVVDDAGLDELSAWVDLVGAEAIPMLGLDTETSITVDFYNRRVRTIQVGNKARQFVIDLLRFAGTRERLVESQGFYGTRNGDIYTKIFSVLDKVLTTSKFLKVGQNLGFEYEVFLWNFGRRIWHLYSMDLAERVIQAGRISLKKYAEFSMLQITQRYFHQTINKDEQKTFDLETPLTRAQVEYAAFDVRMPLAVRLAQMRVLTVDQLLATAQIENDAIGTFVDMHLTGQRLDTERWLRRIDAVKLRRIEEIKTLDSYFLPIVGSKVSAIDYNEIDRLEKIWREDFETPSQSEVDTAVSIRLEKDPERKVELKTVLKNMKQLRSQKKAAARAEYSAASKGRTKKLVTLEKSEGEAFLNYSSNTQLLEVLRKFPGMKQIESVGDEVLLKYNDRPMIQTLRQFRESAKDIGTYGEQWTQKWTTKPCKAEGWLHPNTGRIHSEINPIEAETGRTSSSKPNVQNLSGDEEVRACFIASPPTENEPDGFVLVTVDMSGCELRIIAELSQAQSWIRAFNAKWDVHSISTEILYPEKWPSLSEEGCAYFKLDTNGEPERQQCECKGHKKLRKETKAVNFLLCFGGGPAALAAQIGVNLETAKELMSLHEKKFSEVWSYLRRSAEQGQKNKEARDMYGRRRLFLDPTYENAKSWVQDYEEEKLELNAEECEAALFKFKARELRNPNVNEKWSLTHRAPTEREILHGMKAMFSSVGRKAQNHPAQGTNASIAKRIMGAGFDSSGKGFLWHLLPQYKAHIVNFIHDEWVIECPKRYGQEVLDCVKDAIKRAGREIFKTVAMESEGRISDHWDKG